MQTANTANAGASVGQSGAVPTRGAPSLTRLIDMEMFKLRKRPMTWVSGALLLAAVTAFPILGYIITRADGVAEDLDSFLLPGIIPNLFDVIGAFGSILIVVLAASIVGSEFSWGTVRAMAGSGVSRTKLLAAKLLAIVEIIVILTVGGIIAGTVTSIGLTLIGGHDLSFGWVNGETLGDIGIMFVVAVFLLFVSAVIGFAVATLTRSLAAGIAIGIGITIAESILSAVLTALGGVGETLAKALITSNITTLAARNTYGALDLPDNAPGTLQAVVVLSLYCIVLLSAAFLVFRKRDIPSGA